MPNRKSFRLKDYDYHQSGAYFVTLVTWRRDRIFGEIGDGRIEFSPIGRIIHSELQRLIDHFQNIQWEKFVIMPNHVHGIIVLKESHTRSSHPGIGEKLMSDDDAQTVR